MMSFRVVARYLAAKGERGKDTLPVQNKDTGRVVYVLPETLKEEPSRWDRISPEKPHPEGEPRKQPERARKPRKPRKPHVPKPVVPIPVPYQRPPLPIKHLKPPKRVRPVGPVPVPEPPEPYKKPTVPGRRRYKEGSDG